RSAAFNPKTVALADDVDVGQMRYAPLTAIIRSRVKRCEIARLVHCRIGNCPDQCGHGDIGAHHDNAVRQGQKYQSLWRIQNRDTTYKMHRWPSHDQHKQRDSADQYTGHDGGSSTQHRALDAGCLEREPMLGDMA